jgi:hypothetical protein
MPSKPVELLPPSAPLAAADLIHVAQSNGAGYDSRHASLQEVADSRPPPGSR